MPPRQRVFYGMGGLTVVLPDLVIMQWLLVRYLPADGPPLVTPAVFGTLVLLGRLVEGVANPLVGHWSDVCRHRWGRRMPFLRLGILPFVLAFFLLFHPPVGETHWLNAVYAAGLLVAYFTLFAAVGTPYLALMPEISASSRERVDLMTIQSVFMMLGTFVFAGAGALRDYCGWTAMAGMIALLAAVFLLPTIATTKERSGSAAASTPFGLRRSVGLTLRNRPFRYVVAATSVYWFGLSGMLALIPMWVRVGLSGRDSDVTLLMIPYLLMNLAFFFVFNALSRRFGKYPLMLAAFLGTALVVALFPFVGRFPLGSPFLQTAILLTAAGAPVAGFVVLPYVVLADVVDDDARTTGRRREAVFFGTQGIFQKVGIGLATMAFAVVPYLGGDGHAMTPAGLKVMALFCALAGLVAFLIFLGYPLRETE